MNTASQTPLNDEFQMVVLENCRNPKFKRVTTSKEKFKNLLSTCKVGTKDGTAFSAVTYNTDCSSRSNKGVESSTALAFDIDNSVIDTAKEVSDLGGHENIVVSTSSHKLPDKGNCFRLVVFVDEPIPADKIDEVRQAYDEKYLKPHLTVDPSCKDPGRLYYFTRCDEDRMRLFESAQSDAAPLDWKELLAAVEAPQLAVMPPYLKAADVQPNIKNSKISKNRNTQLTQIAGRLRADGHEEPAIYEKLQAINLQRCEPPLDEGEVATIARSCAKYKVERVLDPEQDAAYTELSKRYAMIEGNGFYDTELKKFVTTAHLRDLTKKMGFREIVVPASNGEYTSKFVNLTDALLSDAQNLKTYRGITFDPGETDTRLLNLSEPLPFEPIQGDVRLPLKLLHIVCGKNKRVFQEFINWNAYAFQNRGKHSNYAVTLHSSSHGTGKGVAARLLGDLHGSGFRMISNKSARGSFNSQMRGATLLFFDEFVGSGSHALDADLKSQITEPTFTINEKFQPEIVTKNMANFLFATNESDAQRVTKYDRRNFIISNPHSKSPQAFFKEFFDWRKSEGAMEALMFYFLNVDLSEYNPHGEAPHTEAKAEMMRDSASDLENWLQDFIEDLQLSFDEGETPRELYTAQELRELYHHDNYHDKLPALKTFSLTLKSLGCDVQKRVRLDGKKNARLWALLDGKKWGGADSELWRVEMEKP